MSVSRNNDDDYADAIEPSVAGGCRLSTVDQGHVHSSGLAAVLTKTRLVEGDHSIAD
jgi:hypothetical protein